MKKYEHAGQPMKYQTVEALEAAINEYFDYCDNRIQQVYSAKQDAVIEIVNPAPYTMSGLALSMGIDRGTLLNYSKNDKFFSTIKAARERVHADVEQRLLGTSNQTGAIFSLKNNFGWHDKTEQDITSGGQPIQIYVPEKLPDGYENRNTQAK
jgi:hypothetical protein